MVSNRLLTVINISLILIIILLFSTLVGLKLPTLGQARYFLDTEQPHCAVQWKQEFQEWADLDQCCLEARQQLQCSKQELYQGGRSWNRVCQTGSGNVLRYWLNNKAYYYCTQQVIW